MKVWMVNPSKFISVVTGDHKDLTGKKAIRILGRLIGETPRDTGHAVSNWIPTVSSPSGKVVTDKNPDARLADANALFAKNALPNFPLLYLTNNVEYIGVLNFGRPPGKQWSLKAPLHFVEAAIDAENKK